MVDGMGTVPSPKIGFRNIVGVAVVEPVELPFWSASRRAASRACWHCWMLKDG